MQKLKGIKVLLVDDEPNIMQFLEMGLQEEGYEIQTAQDGITAVTLAKQFQPHIIIINVMMLGIDGFEVCRILKKTKNVTIIMLSAKDEVDAQMKGLMQEADDYMMKPFGFEDLLARIQGRIRNQFSNLTGEVEIGVIRIDDRRKMIYSSNKSIMKRRRNLS